jgi:alpha-1,3-mannosyltransferase
MGGLPADERMKITHVVRQFLPMVGGLEDVVANLARRQMIQHGMETRVLTLNRLFSNGRSRLPREECIDGIPVLRIPFVGSPRYPIAPTALAHLAGADLVHVHGVDFFYDYLAWTKPLHRKLLVASTHGGYFHTPFARRLKQAYFHSVTRGSSAFYDRIIASSAADAALFRKIAGNRVVAIENGVDTAKFADLASRRPRQTLIYFGRLAAHKRVGLLLPLLQELRRHGPGWRLIVASADEPALMALKDDAARRGLADFAQFAFAPANAALAVLIRQSSYFISPSSYEGFGLAAVEAMSAGLVPILSDIPPFAALVARAGAGLLIEPENTIAAARAILDFDIGLRANLASQRAAAVATATAYAWPKVVERFIEQYRAVLAGSTILHVRST